MARDENRVIRLSVVMPTHNRAERLEHSVLALTRQTAPAATYEIIVVADGCTDATAAMIAGLADHLPCRLRFVAQPPSGPARARNAGAALAAGAILLFLDDDMEASAGLVAAHLAAHQDGTRTVVLGRFWTPPDASAGVVSDGARRWWADCAAARSRPEHRFTFLDVFTGNLSLPKDLFDQVGGFDERIGGEMSGEDYELGVRLFRTGARFQYAVDAASVHHDRPTPQRGLHRAEQQGRGQTRLTQQYPALFWRFELRHIGQIDTWPALRPLSMLLWSRPTLVRPLLGWLVRVVSMAEALGQRRIAAALYLLIRRYHYFLGVRSVVDSRGRWERLQQDAPLEPADITELDIDLALGFDRLDGILAAARPDAVRLSYRDTPILKIDAVFGAEPLRGVHVRDALLQRAPGLLLGLLVERGCATAAEA